MKKNTLAAVLLSRAQKLRLLFFILLALIASFLTINVHSLFGVETSRSPDYFPSRVSIIQSTTWVIFNMLSTETLSGVSSSVCQYEFSGP